MKQTYIPISCNYYDELEAFATLKQKCRILYVDPDGNETTVYSIILDLYTRDKVEYMKLEQNFIIRLDQLISVNDKVLEAYC